MKLWQYIVRRLLGAIPVLFGVTLLSFSLTRIWGNPIAAYASNPNQITPGLERQITKEYHLDEPLPIQYGYYLKDLVTGDWGYSPQAGTTVINALKLYVPATVELTLAAMFIAIAFGIPLGIISAVKKNTWIDQVIRVVSLVGRSMPIYWLGLLLQFGFHYWLPEFAGFPRLPSTNRIDPLISFNSITGLYLLDALIQGNLIAFGNAFSHLILPAFTLGYSQMAIIVRLTRAGMTDVLQEDFIIFAKAKGLKERTVLFKHALKNAITPVLTESGYLLAALMGGAVLTETIFAWPGLGRWSTRCIITMDYGGIMGFVLFFGLVFVFINLIVDILYSVFDPRVRLGE